MLPIVLSVFLGIFAIAVLVKSLANGVSERLKLRVAALGRKAEPARQEEATTDIQRDQQKLSAFPWLNRWLANLNLASVSALFLYQSGVTLSLGTLLMTSVGSAAGVGGLVYFQTGNALLAMLAAAGISALPFCYVRHQRSRRLLKLERQLPEALGTMASALRVGHSLVASLGAVAQESQEPIGGEIRRCFEEQNYGVDLRTSLVNLTLRVPVQDFRILVAAVMIQRESGGNLAEVLERLALTTRERFRLKKQVSIHTAQGRMTGWILSILPIVLGLGMYLLNPDGMSILWKRSVGLKMLYAAAGMDLVGALIIRKIVEIRV